uniref:Reverse transcriptase domain-containing protein n=1 Tax=Stegastes partitus TaxID=144197 RepID=A0A3B4YV99_9TELE
STIWPVIHTKAQVYSIKNDSFMNLGININNSFVEFYKNLYNSESDCHSDSLTHDFLSAVNLPQASDAQRELLNRPITREEVMEAISALKNNKAPGPDSLTPEFYKAFCDLLIDPLLDMLSYSFNSGGLPHTMMDANIFLILKKGKAAEDCASYRPISLLDVDRKLLAKILARRLEGILSDIISVDQTGFISGRNSSNNTRRLLNLIQHSSGSKAKSLVISLDAEKAFDRTEQPYLLKVLSKFNLGDNFIKWISLLYAAPQASVITNGLKSPAFTVRSVCRQGCPASPLLFALAIEPLVEALRNDLLLSGIEIGPIHYKISLYCDDVLLFLSNPVISIARAVEIISDFSCFSGYRINYSKSEAMPLTPNLSWSPSCSTPFRWSPSGFVYLGIKITPSIYGLYKANFVPLIRRIEEDLARSTALPLSLLGRVHPFKMSILPRLLYPFQMIPCSLNTQITL